MHLSFLRPLYETAGPWASVYLDGTRNTEDAATQVRLRWRAARAALEMAGCGPATAGALEATLLERPAGEGPQGLVAFAAGGRTALSRVLPAPPRREIAAFGPLPHVMPLLAQLGESLPYVQVRVDRTGGDIEAVDAGRLVHTAEVEGRETFPLHRVKPGGWSQPRYQRAAHVTWQRNAGDVAAAVAEAAQDCAAEVIVVAGDPQARPMLVARLPEYWQERTVQTDIAAGARAPGADHTALDDVTVAAIAQRAAANARVAFDRYHTQHGNDAAGAGLPAVVAALQRGQADTVLLVDDPTSTAELWIGPEPLQVSFDRAELLAMGVVNPQRVRADAALARAIACSEADLLFAAPEEVPAAGGVAAVLRYADAATRRR
ncbi:Vms1/Ankzf1 family peptidyl-tRNA hydrolase [Dactylosporangium sp. CA-139066]|uniref:baeRF2 domain-containing protein n=1 Tax=Dactylosporangium sp. CA-139066 TaxID=3239930 RepID=UPI003D8FD145